jgi:glucose/arabinose dehydrogenase
VVIVASVTCPHCGVEVPASSTVFCPICAQPLSEQRAEPPTPPPPPAVAAPAAVPASAPAYAAPAAGLLFPWGFHQLAPGDSVIVGREHPPFASQLEAFPNVSRGHARLEHRDGALLVTDLGSTNGTRIDGRLIDAEVAEPLAGGQEVRFGAILAATVVASPTGRAV